MGKKGNKRWDSYDEEYVRENLGRLSFEDMGRYLGRSPMSVRLYVLRRKLTTGQLVRRNLLMALLKIKFRHPERLFSYKNVLQGNGYRTTSILGFVLWTETYYRQGIFCRGRIFWHNRYRIYRKPPVGVIFGRRIER